MITTYQVIIPEYLVKVQVAEERRAKYYAYAKLEDLPPTIVKRLNKKELTWDDGYLYNPKTQEYVIKNARLAGKPRFLFVSGNQIYSQLNEHSRIRIVTAIKDSFRPHLSVLPKPLPFPIRLRMNLFCNSKYGRWDLDNLWIYYKCFQDLLVDEGYLTDDSIQFITSSGGIEYFPTFKEEDRKMVFEIMQDKRPEIVNHNLYKLHIKKNIVTIGSQRGISDDGKWLYEVIEDRVGKPGTLFIDETERMFHISTGKKQVLISAVTKGLDHVFSQSVQGDINPKVEKTLYLRHMDLFHSQILNKGITIYVYERGYEIYDCV